MNKLTLNECSKRKLEQTYLVVYAIKNEINIKKNGNFYIAVGKDEIALNKKIGLKLICMGPELCKVGFPVSAFES